MPNPLRDSTQTNAPNPTEPRTATHFRDFTRSLVALTIVALLPSFAAHATTPSQNKPKQGKSSARQSSSPTSSAAKAPTTETAARIGQDEDPTLSTSQPAPSAPNAATNSVGATHSAAKDPSAKLLWDYWYTMTINGAVKYGYYNDRVEIKNGRIQYRNSLWKKEEGFINEEQLGAIAQNDPQLTPVFFNYRSVYRSTETIIDGSVGDGRILTVKIRKGTSELPPIKKALPSKVFLEAHFPFWISQRLPQMKVGQTISYSALNESDPEQSFRPISGQARLEKPDEFALKTRTQKLTIQFSGVKSQWWVEPSGAPMRIEIPAQGVSAIRTSEQAAQTYLNDSE